jgi:lysophospholipase L1-like esterase
MRAAHATARRDGDEQAAADYLAAMPPVSRRSFLAAAAAAPFALPTVRRQDPPAELAWTDVVDWPIEGRAFAARKAPYDRLPAAAEGVVRKEVWDLSRNSAGMAVRFATDSPTLRVRYRVSSERLAMAHMPATGVSGVDLYGRDGDAWRWLEVSRPQKQAVEHTMFAKAKAGERREFTLYLPLYNGVDKLELGVAADAKLAPLPAREPAKKPVVVYGTSIAHGACASRPGMAWPAILGRRIDREVVNLGFSGNGRMEPEVGRFVAELDAGAFVIDCLPNMNAKQVAERTEPLVAQLRRARPTTPILLVEDRTFASAWFDDARRAEHDKRRQALRDAHARLVAAGDDRVHLLAGASLLGDDDEGTTDGSHPNDLGMMRMAEAVHAAVAPLLGA